MAALKHHHRDEEPTVVERGLTALEQLLAVALAGDDRDGSGGSPEDPELEVEGESSTRVCRAPASDNPTETIQERMADG